MTAITLHVLMIHQTRGWSRKKLLVKFVESRLDINVSLKFLTYSSRSDGGSQRDQEELTAREKKMLDHPGKQISKDERDAGGTAGEISSH